MDFSNTATSVGVEPGNVAQYEHAGKRPTNLASKWTMHLGYSSPSVTGMNTMQITPRMDFQRLNPRFYKTMIALDSAARP